MKSGLLLNVVVAQGASVLQLLAGENETLLVRRDTLLVLNLLLDRFNGVGRLDLQRNGLASKSLNENLHGSLVEALGRKVRPSRCVLASNGFQGLEGILCSSPGQRPSHKTHFIEFIGWYGRVCTKNTFHREHLAFQHRTRSSQVESRTSHRSGMDEPKSRLRHGVSGYKL